MRAPHPEPPGHRWYAIDWSTTPPSADTLRYQSDRAADIVNDLKSRLEKASIDERIKICTRIAELQVAAADKLFTAGNTEDARRAVEEVATYLEKARDAAMQSGHRLKETEIAARKSVRRLEDIKRSLAFEDQPIVEQSIKRLEDVRTSLLERMFRKEKKK